MFGFFNRVFSSWGPSLRKGCTCGYEDINRKECPYCLNDEEGGQGGEDLGLSRPDVNFYFAAISVCSPFIASFGLVAADLPNINQSVASKLTSQTSIGLGSVGEFTVLNEQSSAEQASTQEAPGSKTNADPGQSASSDQSTVESAPSQSKDTSPTRSRRGRYDYMSLFNDRGGPKERYYVPKASRINRCPTYPTSHSNSANASDGQSSASTSVVMQQTSSSILSPEKTVAISKLRAILEEYRMIVTNSTSICAVAPMAPENGDAVVVSVSIKSLLQNSQTIDSIISECDLPSTSPGSHRHHHPISATSSNSNENILGSDLQLPTPTLSTTSSSSTPDEPMSLVVTIPTPATVVPAMYSSRTPNDDGDISSTAEPSYMIRRLLSSTPGLEQELRDRAADVWGAAVGFDDRCVGSFEGSIEACPEEDQQSFDSSSDYQKSRDGLKQRIKELLTEVGLLEKFEKELTVVKKGNSKFHQAQQVVPGLWVGSFYTASNRLRLYSLGITHIVCCVNVQPPFTRDFHYIVLPCEDKSDQDILRFFPRTNHFIKTALMEGGRVLVHCGAGISRAPTVCAAFLIQELKVSADLALRLVQAARPFADPNEGFKDQLKSFQDIVQRELSSLPLSSGATSDEDCSDNKETTHHIEHSPIELGEANLDTVMPECTAASDVFPEDDVVQEPLAHFRLDKSVQFKLSPSAASAISETGNEQPHPASAPQSPHLPHRPTERWSATRSVPDFRHFATDASFTPHFTGLIMSSSLLARQLKSESNGNQATPKGPESPSTHRTPGKLERQGEDRAGGRSSRASKSPSRVDASSTSKSVYTKHVGYYTSQSGVISKSPKSPSQRPSSIMAVLNVHGFREDKSTYAQARYRAVDERSVMSDTGSRSRSHSDYPHTPSDVPQSPHSGAPNSTGVTRRRFRSYSYAATHSDVANAVVQQNLNSLRGAQQAAQDRQKRREAISRARGYSIHLAGIDRDDLSVSVKVGESNQEGEKHHHHRHQHLKHQSQQQPQQQKQSSANNASGVVVVNHQHHKDESVEQPK